MILPSTVAVEQCKTYCSLLLFPTPKSSKIPPCRSQFTIRHETRGHTHAPSLEVAVGYKITTGSRVRMSVYLYTVKVRGDATYLRFLWRSQTNKQTYCSY
eukprot:sb/3478668/